MENQDTPQSNSSKKKKIIIGIAVVLVVCVLFFVGKAIDSFIVKHFPDTKKANAIITVGDYGYALEDMMYYIYTEEETGAIYDQIYSQFYGTSYWEMEDEQHDNLTGQQLSKKNVLNAVKKDLVWYQEALKAGYTLTDDDKSAAKDAYDAFVKNLSDEQKAQNGMGDELLSYFEKQQVIDHYKEDLLEEANFDYDATVADISKEEYREYKYEYYCIYKEDDEGKTYSKDKLKEHMDTLKQLRSKVKADSDMESFLTDEMLEYVEYGDDSLVEKDGEGYGTYRKVDIDAMIKGMENGQMSDIVETEFAYYVFRMDDNNSEEAYESELENVVNKAQNKIYNTSYKNAKKNYNVTVKQDKWDKVTLGSIIFNPASLEE